MTLALVPKQLGSPFASGSDTGLEDGVEGVASTRRQNREELNLVLWELELQSYDALVLSFPISKYTARLGSSSSHHHCLQKRKLEAQAGEADDPKSLS